MARLPRLVVPGLPHHVLLRGHRSEPVFADDIDRSTFRNLLRDLGPPHGVAVHAYVLLPAEVQLLLTPAAPGDLGRFIQALGRHYVRGFNTRRGRSGGLWEGRFRSTVLDPADWLLPCMQYIESRPVSQNLVSDPAHFPWSSFAHHAGTGVDPVVSDHSAFWSLGNTPFERQSTYRDRFDRELNADMVNQIERATMHGWALGGTSFVESLARQTTRRPTPRRAGRPRKML